VVGVGANGQTSRREGDQDAKRHHRSAYEQMQRISPGGVTQARLLGANSACGWYNQRLRGCRTADLRKWRLWPPQRGLVRCRSRLSASAADCFAHL
jgi:hypothetical protein